MHTRNVSAQLLSDDFFFLTRPGLPPAAVNLAVSASSLSWVAVDAAAPSASSACLLPHADAISLYDACWAFASPTAQPSSGRLLHVDILGASLSTPAASKGGTGQPRGTGDTCAALLTVTHVDRKRCGPADAPWTVGTVVFEASAAAASRLNASLEKALRSRSGDRPRQLLVVLSPASGCGAARRVWAERAAPVFSAAGVAVRLVVTQRRGDAHELARALAQRVLAASALSPPPPPLAATFSGGGGGGGAADSPRCAPPPPPPAASEFPDGIVVVGGDGLFSEVLNGLLAHPGAGALALARLRLGIIPCGSTDATACTLYGAPRMGNQSSISRWFGFFLLTDRKRDDDTHTLSVSLSRAYQAPETRPPRRAMWRWAGGRGWTVCACRRPHPTAPAL